MHPDALKHVSEVQCAPSGTMSAIISFSITMSALTTCPSLTIVAFFIVVIIRLQIVFACTFALHAALLRQSCFGVFLEPSVHAQAQHSEHGLAEYGTVHLACT